jgi:hypothetical protein
VSSGPNEEVSMNEKELIYRVLLLVLGRVRRLDGGGCLEPLIKECTPEEFDLLIRAGTEVERRAQSAREGLDG